MRRNLSRSFTYANVVAGICLWAKGPGTWLCLGIARRDVRPDVRRTGMPPEPVV